MNNSRAAQSARSVFVSNISFDASEHAIREVLSRVGKVNNLSLQYDRETGKPRGFGFVEYSDPQTAQAAVRNLDGHDFHGRSMRVKMKDDPHQAREKRENREKGGHNNHNNNNNHNNKMNMRHSDSRSMQGMSRQGDNSSVVGSRVAQNPMNPIHQARDSKETITNLVTQLSREQRLEVLTEMKKLVVTNPTVARTLLNENPFLGETLLQIQLSFNLVKPADLAALMVQQQQRNLPPQPPQPPQMPTRPPMQPRNMGFQQPPQRPMPPMQPQSRPPPPVQQDPFAALTPAQRENLISIGQMTPEAVAMLPPDQQAQVRALQAQYRSLTAGRPR